MEMVGLRVYARAAAASPEAATTSTRGRSQATPSPQSQRRRGNGPVTSPSARLERWRRAADPATVILLFVYGRTHTTAVEREWDE